MKTIPLSHYDSGRTPFLILATLPGSVSESESGDWVRKVGVGIEFDPHNPEAERAAEGVERLIIGQYLNAYVRSQFYFALQKTRTDLWDIPPGGQFVVGEAGSRMIRRAIADGSARAWFDVNPLRAGSTREKLIDPLRSVSGTRIEINPEWIRGAVEYGFWFPPGDASFEVRGFVHRSLSPSEAPGGLVYAKFVVWVRPPTIPAGARLFALPL